MSVTVIVGAQWGDEGKGKIVDLLSENVEWVARYQGGPNAGHTVVVNDQEIILHQIPSGILWPHTKCVIGNGVVVDPNVFLEELSFIKSLGVDVKDRLFISDRAHLILSYHRTLDAALEEANGHKKIGTTGRGIGPAYGDKIGRIGVRMVDLLDQDELGEQLSHSVHKHNQVLQRIDPSAIIDEAKVKQQCLKFAKVVTDCITDTSVLLHQAVNEGNEILIEGAQGTMLDVDFGTYPFVTSSNPVAGGACVGLGLGPKVIDNVFGIVKAYTTRVGMGPFPTEFDEEYSESVRQLGSEFGATTGRPRRCGWFDSVVVNTAVRVNGLTALAITKLDVLDTLEEIKICIGYQYQDQLLTHYPASLKAQNTATPVYESHEGWMTSTSEAKNWNDLPLKAKQYLLRIQELTRTPIRIVSVGPERNQTILIEK